MNMTDVVAEFIHKGHCMTAETIPGMSVAELYKHTRSTTDHPHPQQSLTLEHKVSVGDMFRPVDVDIITMANEPRVVTPFQRYIIFRLSCPSTQYVLNGKNSWASTNNDVKSIVLAYNNVEDAMAVKDIASVICLSCHISLTNLLSVCNLQCNVAHLL